MGIFSSIFGGGSNKKKKKEEERIQRAVEAERGQTSLLAALGMREGYEQKARQEAAEAGKLEVMGLLGRPGSYEVPSTLTPSSAPPTATGIGDTIYDPTKTAPASLVGTLTGTPPPGAAESIMAPFTGVLDPKKYAEAIGQTSDFRTMSRLTAEFEQGVAGKGPLFDQFTQSVTGPIMEGAANTYRESMDEINRMAASGGTARRAALKDAMTMQATEAANRVKAQNLWQANLAIKEYFVQGARTQAMLNQEWLSSLPFQETYNTNMRAATEFIAGTTIPKAIETAQHGASREIAYRAMKIENQSKSNWLGKLVGAGVATLTGSLLAGDGTMRTDSMSTLWGAANTLFSGGYEGAEEYGYGSAGISSAPVFSPQGYGIFGRQ
jgi:hypothetical protein